MEKKTDLRVIKTKRRIKEVFTELLNKKELKKITVTEISRIAEINKGTFYLHYKDIYELYSEVLQDMIYQNVDSIPFLEEFFDAPETFVFHFFEFGNKHFCEENILFQSGSFIHMQMVMELMTNAFCEKLYQQGKILKTPENDTKLEYILFGLFHFMMETSEEKYPIISKLIIEDIRSAFKGEIKNDKNQVL